MAAGHKDGWCAGRYLPASGVMVAVRREPLAQARRQHLLQLVGLNWLKERRLSTVKLGDVVI